MSEVYVKKKAGNLEHWDPRKIERAVKKSADRAGEVLSPEEYERLTSNVEIDVVRRGNTVPVEVVHSLVEAELDKINSNVAKSYRDYRNWAKREAEMNARITAECNAVQFLGDKSNANADSTMVSTKRVKKLDILETAQYEEYFLTEEERAAAATGYIYIHDKGARQDTSNCCLFDVGAVLAGGFEMGNVWYNEPKSVDTAFDVIGDITLMAASQQYGGFTLPQIDEVLAPYAEKTYQANVKTYVTEAGMEQSAAEKLARKDTIRDIEQGVQGWEYKFNTVASSRGDYPFITTSFGLATDEWGREISKAILRVRAKGQGKEGHKKPVLFPRDLGPALVTA